MDQSTNVIDERALAETVFLDRVRVFNDRLVASVFVSPLGIAFVVWLQAVAVGLKQAMVWGALIVACEILILGVGQSIRKAVFAKSAVNRWVRMQLAACGLLGLTWGASVWFVWNADQFLYYITTVCVLVGVSFVTMVVMAPMRWATALFTGGMLVLPMAHLMLVSHPAPLEIGVGLLVMGVIQLRYSVVLRNELMAQIDSTVRNGMLVERLTHVGQQLTQAITEKDARNAELNVVMEQLNSLVTFDQLTGAYSRRYFMDTLERQMALSVRHGSIASLIMLDLDHFKAINDQFGHAVGDRVLHMAAKTAMTELRDGDMFARVGGEEFIALLPMTGQDDAMKLAERLRISLAGAAIDEEERVIRISVSAGVAELSKEESSTAWLRRVDMALYEAKTKGRNCVVAAS
jgi:diguanylate cyclase (GGDEF)-like protein